MVLRMRQTGFQAWLFYSLAVVTYSKSMFSSKEKLYPLPPGFANIFRAIVGALEASLIRIMQVLPAQVA